MSSISSPQSPCFAVPWRHVLAGMHTGQMITRPIHGEFGAVLTVAAHPGTVDDGIRHRHLPLSHVNLDEDALTDAVDWVFSHVLTDRTVLVRSEGGAQRPGLIIACVCVRLGATYDEALDCLRRSGPLGELRDFRYLDILRQITHRG